MTKRRKITPSIADNTNKQEKIIDQLTGSDDDKGTVRITLDIPKMQHQKIKAYTKQRGMSMKGYLLFLAEQDMKGSS